MAKKKIILRVDGNSNMGLGHIYRGIALAEMLKNEFEVLFVLRPDSVAAPAREAGFPVKFVPESVDLFNEPEWLGQNYSKDSIIVLDGYHFTEEYQRNIKKEGFKLVYIDDLVKGHMVADLVINHAPGITERDYDAETYTQFALGTNYAILRPAFLEAAKQSRTIEKIDKAFVCFGGSDIHDLTYTTTEALLAIEQIKKINVVVGKAYKHKKLFNLEQKNPTIHVYKDLSENDLLNVMLDSNIALVPASTILYEVCAAKMPVVSGYFIDNQKDIYSGFRKKKVIKGIGDFKSLNRHILINKVKFVIRNKTVVNDALNKQTVLYDRFINDRFIKFFKVICCN